MNPLTKVTYKDQPAANNAFIGAQIKLEEVITRLQYIHSNITPCKNWAHAEGTCHMVNKLVEVTNEAVNLVK